MEIMATVKHRRAPELWKLWWVHSDSENQRRAVASEHFLQVWGVHSSDRSKWAHPNMGTLKQILWGEVYLHHLWKTPSVFKSINCYPENLLFLPQSTLGTGTHSEVFWDKLWTAFVQHQISWRWRTSVKQWVMCEDAAEVCELSQSFPCAGGQTRGRWDPLSRCLSTCSKQPRVVVRSPQSYSFTSFT